MDTDTPVGWIFDSVKLSAATCSVIRKLGFEKPTPVQKATIPLFLSHKDVVVEAVTGSGKTLAFLLPVLEILSRKIVQNSGRHDSNELGAIVLAPTRELATQIHKVLLELCQDDYKHLTSKLLIGGSDIVHDIQDLQRTGCVNIIISTPGRLADILNRNLLNTKSLEILILDEADRLLNLGFEQTITSILERIPKQRRTGLFSATMSDALSELIRTGLRNPVKITVKVESSLTGEEQKLPETLTTYYLTCEYESRLPFILSLLLPESSMKKFIIYFGTCASVDYFASALPLILKGTESPALFALHGKMESRKRTRIYQQFLASERAVLLCTDLAARGLDFQDIDLVIQYEAPQDPTTFVHRCGRTARSGRMGQALVLLGQSEESYVSFLLNRQIPLRQYDHETPKDSLFLKLREINSQDRDLFEKEHRAKFIFKLQNLDLASVARSLGLLRSPKMKELIGVKWEGFTESDINVKDILFKDPKRNIQKRDRLEALKNKKKQRKIVSEKDKVVNDFAKMMKNQKQPQSHVKTVSNVVDLRELDEDWKELKKSKSRK